MNSAAPQPQNHQWLWRRRTLRAPLAELRSDAVEAAGGDAR